MKHLKFALVAAVALGGLALASGSASAMPNGLPSASTALSANVQDVRWVCGPYRCWWRPGYAYYGPGPRWGWGGGWHRWHRW
jgi:hypothetical protein